MGVRAHSAPAVKVTAWERLRGALREFGVYGILAGASLLIVEAVIGRVAPRGASGEVLTIAVVVCVLPVFLMLSLVLLVDSSLSPRWTFSLRPPRENMPPRQAHREDLDGAFAEAMLFWDYERQQVDALRWRFRLHGMFFGFFALVTFAMPMIIAPAVLVTPTDALKAGRTWTAAAIALESAALVCFTRDFARMLVRAANRDSSTQMFAWSTKRLFVIVVATVLLTCLQGIEGLSAKLFETGIGYVLMGAGVAILGDRAAMSVTERVAKVLGANAPKRQPGEDLPKLEGLEEEDVSRLAEEGIDSIHALAFHSTPKLFFSTPYSLMRICDWQDQALLIARLGETTARLFREQLAIRGAVDARSLACEFLTERLAQDKKEDLCKILGFTYFQAEWAMRRLADDEISRKLLVYRQAAPFSHDAGSDAEQSPSPATTGVIVMESGHHVRSPMKERPEEKDGTNV